MKIGISSQNFRTITGHAGKTRRFLIYDVDTTGNVIETERLDLPKSQSMHETAGHAAHPIDQLDVLVTQSAGGGFGRKMAERGIKLILTSESDPLTAANAVARGETLPPPIAEADADETHEHRHGHNHSHSHDHAHQHNHEHGQCGGHGHGHRHGHHHGHGGGCGCGH